MDVTTGIAQKAYEYMRKHKLEIWGMGQRLYGFTKMDMPSSDRDFNELSARELTELPSVIWDESNGFVKDRWGQGDAFIGTFVKQEVDAAVNRMFKSLDDADNKTIDFEKLEIRGLAAQIEDGGNQGPVGGIPIHEIPEDDEEETEELDLNDLDGYFHDDSPLVCDCGAEKHGWGHSHWCQIITGVKK